MLETAHRSVISYSIC